MPEEEEEEEDTKKRLQMSQIDPPLKLPKWVNSRSAVSFLKSKIRNFAPKPPNFADLNPALQRGLARTEGQWDPRQPGCGVCARSEER